MFSMRIPAEIKGRWDVAAKRAGLTLPAWIIIHCERAVSGAAGVAVTGPMVAQAVSEQKMADAIATADETAALPVETKKKLLAAVGKLKRAQSEKKVKRAAAAESTRASVQVPQRRGEMVDVKMAEPNLVAQCPHHHGYGEVCYKCDPKMGYPSIG